MDLACDHHASNSSTKAAAVAFSRDFGAEVGLRDDRRIGIDLTGQVQLSDELSKQAGRDLVRYTQEGGRVTLPATITGSADAPQVRIDTASLAKRAITNRATEEVQKALKKGLSGLFKK